MKKIIAIAVLFLAFSFNANAQVSLKVKETKTEAITPESIVKQHDELAKTVAMNEILANDMMTLLKMRMIDVNAAATAEEKKAIFVRYSQKLLGGFTPEQLKQFKSNNALYLKLTQY